MDLAISAQPQAGHAGTGGGGEVEAEVMGLHFTHDHPMVGTGEAGVEGLVAEAGVFRVQDMEAQEAFAHQQAMVERGQYLFVEALLDHEAIDHRLELIGLSFV